MKKIKVENISGIKLDFFLKQNKQDVRVVLNPGEYSWCDEGSSTRSMILYERKNLIKSSSEEIENLAPPLTEEDRAKIKESLEDPTLKERIKKNLEDFSNIEIKNPPKNAIAEDIHEIQPLSEPIGTLLYIDFKYEEQPSTLEKAQKETEEYKKESEKKYKGKKRGRKKKRGPKPGSKRKKNGDNSSPQTPIQ